MNKQEEIRDIALAYFKHDNVIEQAIVRRAETVKSLRDATKGMGKEELSDIWEDKIKETVGTFYRIEHGDLTMRDGTLKCIKYTTNAKCRFLNLCLTGDSHGGIRKRQIRTKIVTLINEEQELDEFDDFYMRLCKWLSAGGWDEANLAKLLAAAAKALEEDA